MHTHTTPGRTVGKNWTDTRIVGRTDGRMCGRLHGRSRQRTDAPIDGRVGRMDRWADGRSHRMTVARTTRRKDGCIDGLMLGWTDARMVFWTTGRSVTHLYTDRLTGGRTHARADARTDRRTDSGPFRRHCSPGFDSVHTSLTCVHYMRHWGYMDCTAVVPPPPRKPKVEAKASTSRTSAAGALESW